MGMKVYVVFKSGVYRHECGGVFSTVEAASVAAERCIAGERDGHHGYEVVPFELDVQTTQTPVLARVGFGGHTFFQGGELEEAEALCTWVRENGVVSKTPNVK